MHGGRGEAELAFTAVVTDFLDDRAQRHPDLATELGDHRFDGRLPEYSAAALAAERAAVDGFAARLDAVDTAALPAADQLDAGLLGNALRRRMFELGELREPYWNPVAANPGRAIHKLIISDFAPLPDRLAAVAGRLAAVPGMLAGARELLGAMPRVHLETAISQFAGTISVVTGEIDAALRAAPRCTAQIDAVRPAAVEALTAHRAWLSARLAAGLADGEHGPGFADPRIGPERFARKLSLTLDAAADSGAILARAHADLDLVTEQITELAAELAGRRAASAGNGSARGGEGDPVVREVLGRLAADAPDNQTIRPLCQQALAAQTAFVAEHGLVTVYPDPVEVIEMPEIDRGVGAAYCDSPGALESAPIPAYIAVSPTPADWPPGRVASFYREYNRHMVHTLMAHEAMPGHYLQLQHSRRFTGSSTPLRAVLRSGSFVEGWAVYAEELMTGHGYPGEGDPRHVRMQQLKMQLRMIINTILDARVHAHGMTETEAMALMTGRGYQEEGEAVGKWRRVQLSSAQLSTYYVGYTEIADLAAGLKAASPHAPLREIHDRMLAHGSPPVRRLRPLLVG